MKIKLSLCLAILFITACTKTDEEKRLTKFRKSIPYKTYRFASEKTTDLVLDEYNKLIDFPIQPHVAHATLGFVCLIGKKSEYAFIEAELAKESTSAEIDILAMGIQSIALAKLHCSHLAREQYVKIKAALAHQQKHAPARLDDLEGRLMFASLLAASLYQDDAELAIFSAKSLGDHTQFDYLPSLVSALLEIKRGRPQEALGHLQKLSQNKNVHESTRAFFTESTASLANTSASAQEKEAIIDGLILQLLNLLLDDLFSNENQQRLLKKISVISDQFTKGFPLLPPATTNSPGSSATAP